MSDSNLNTIRWSEERALGSVFGSKSDLKELLEIWLQHTQKMLPEVKAALATKNTSQLESTTHALRGSLQVICEIDPNASIFKLEQFGKTGDLSHGNEYLLKLETEVSLITQDVLDYLATH